MCALFTVAKHGAAFVEVWAGGAWLSTLLPSFARRRLKGAKHFANADAVHVVVLCRHLHVQMASSVKCIVMTSQRPWARAQADEMCVSPEICLQGYL